MRFSEDTAEARAARDFPERAQGVDLGQPRGLSDICAAHSLPVRSVASPQDLSTRSPVNGV